MDSFNLANLKAGKANAIMKQQKFRRIANLFRLVEVCVFLILLSRISFQVPVAVKNSGDYFRGFSVFMVSPRFVFVIGNIIIITLFAQSGQFTARGSKSKSLESDLYQQFIQNITKNQKIKEEQNNFPEKHSIRTEDEGNQKHPENDSTIAEDPTKDQKTVINEANKNHPEGMKKEIFDEGKIKWLKKENIRTRDRKGLDYRRCETQKSMEFEREKPGSVLRRSETEKITISNEEDGMSNEEFRRAVEEFIARQQKLRREEENSII
ncbi:uncharacterized protein LOC114725572 [Neltuma alba]|uniref:uncharacterized protein LOC114725572 n=1 Tax=Neltuma alba TaxID=207710 RepID=UPI0010A4F068|nr:uncharacterized protein LOC114725572 [Prosopis alba]